MSENPRTTFAVLGALGIYADHVMDQIEDMNRAMQEKKKWILAEWKKTYDMPRKMKKRRRKELQLDWNIASWDPLGIRDILDGRL